MTNKKVRVCRGEFTAAGVADRLRPQPFLGANGVILIAFAAVCGGKMLIIRWIFAS